MSAQNQGSVSIPSLSRGLTENGAQNTHSGAYEAKN